MNINQAKQRVADIQEQKRLEREMHKPSPNQRMAEDAKDYLPEYDFWCDNCGDVKLECHKTWHRLFGDHIAVYRGHCNCGEELIRHITHRDHDPYYYLSDKIHIQRNEYWTDLLQADQYGFRSHYGEPWKEYYEKLEREEERIIRGEREKGFSGLSFEAEQELKRIRNL